MPTSPTRDELCAQYEMLLDELESDAAFGTQAAIHSARKLSQMAGLYVAPSPVGTRVGAADEPLATQADDDIRRVLQAVAWETTDLVVATRPVALECGWEWPVTATPPAVQPRPPAS